jgi:di/tricarboxylate transporter
MKARFVLRFLLAFAILIPLGAATQAPHAYATALRATAAVLSPALSGWSLERTGPPDRSQLRFRRGAESLPVRLSLDSLALGLLPLLSLIWATPRMRVRQRSTTALLGVGGLFLLHLLVLVAYPWMVRDPDAVKDISGTFLGLLTFVGGPAILWFALTYESLRDVWRL